MSTLGLAVTHGACASRIHRIWELLHPISVLSIGWISSKLSQPPCQPSPPHPPCPRPLPPLRLEQYLSQYKKCLVMVSHSQVRAWHGIIDARPASTCFCKQRVHTSGSRGQLQCIHGQVVCLVKPQASPSLSRAACPG